MSLTVAELAEQVEKTNDRLAGSIETLTKEFANFRTDVSSKLSSIDTSLNVVKWAGAFAATFLGGLFIGAVTLAWNASALNSEVKQQNSDLQEIKQRLDQVVPRATPKP